MTRNPRSQRVPKLPKPPGPKSTRPPTPTELWYLGAYKILAAHYKRIPSISEIATYTKRSTFPVYDALLSLERKGRLKRNDQGRFEIVEGA